MGFLLIFSLSKQVMDMWERNQWIELEGTRAMRACWKYQEERRSWRSSNPLQWFLYPCMVLSSLRSSNRNIVWGSKRWKFRLQMVGPISSIYPRRTGQNLLLQYWRMMKLFLKYKRTWEYQFVQGFLRYHLSFIDMMGVNQA